MILVVGGTSSGKKSYVEKILGYDKKDMADGILDEKPVIFNVHHLIEKDIENSLELIKPLLTKDVVICNEMGSGIIPINEKDRLLREANGKLCNILAEEAKKVVRLVCGVESIIKG